jgi:hypothetical protein
MPNLCPPGSYTNLQKEATVTSLLGSFTQIFKEKSL